MGLLFSFVWLAIKSMLGLALTIGFYFVLALGVTYVMSAYWTQQGLVYGPEDGVDDTLWLMVILSFWDRLFGPSSTVLRKVAKHLPSGRKAATTSDNYEFDSNY